MMTGEILKVCCATCRHFYASVVSLRGGYGECRKLYLPVQPEIGTKCSAWEAPPAPASPRPEEPGAPCGKLPMVGCVCPHAEKCAGLAPSPRAQPEAPRCGGCGYLPSFDSVEQGVYAPSGEPCPGCPDCAGRSSQPEVKP